MVSLTELCPQLESDSLTSLGVVVHILVDGAKEVLLLAAKLPGPQDISDTLVEVRILTLRGGK